MSKLLLLSVLLISLVTFASCGSGGASNSGTSGGGGNVVAPAGPIDGTWKETGVLCNGAAATGTATQTFTPPNVMTYVLTNTTGMASFSTGACTISSAMTISYAAGNSATVTSVGSWSCNPAGCAGATCGSAVSAASTTFHYTLTAPTVGLLVTGGADQTCTGANPVQADPVTHIFTKQ